MTLLGVAHSGLGLNDSQIRDFSINAVLLLLGTISYIQDEDSMQIHTAFGAKSQSIPIGLIKRLGT